MINYRIPSARSAVGLHIDREKSDQIWQALVVDKKRFGFNGPPDPPRQGTLLESQIQELPALLEGIDTSDLLLFSNLTKTKRETRLLGTYRAALEQLDERGVNTLFLVLGMLRWKEPSETDTHLAPLFLVPVQLDRTGRGDFKVFYDEGEIGTNLSLKVKLEELGIRLPDIPTEFDSIQPNEYFAQVAKLVETQEGWEVLNDEVALNFFSFEKIALYLDLAISRWPEDATPLQDTDIVAALGSGYIASETNLTEDTRLDEVRSVEEAREIFQADSSQLLVMEEARRGTSMVVEGPPGTGKSQTITNLIAELVSQGKKVLFVSEKIAALEVVYRKLEEAGIANSALELHGNKSNRKKFYEEIKRTWSLKSQVKDASLRLERLAEVRSKLNQYVKELHEPLTPYQVSPRRLLTLSCSLPLADEQDSDSGYDPTPLQEISWLEMERLRPTICLLQAKTQEIGVPNEHPFWGSTLVFFGPDERMETERALAQTLAQCRLLRQLGGELASKLGIAGPVTLADTSVLYNCVEAALAAPPHEGVDVRLGIWRQNEAAIRETIATLRSRNATLSEHSADFLSSAWEQDWTQVQSVVARRADSFFGRLTGEYKQAVAQITVHRASLDKLRPETVKVASKALFKAQAEQAAIKEKEATISPLFGVHWTGLKSNPDQLEGLLVWVLKLESDVHAGTLPESLVNLFSGRIDSEDLKNASMALQATDQSFRQLLEKAIDLVKARYVRLPEQSLSQIEEKLGSWQTHLSRVSEIVGWNLLIRDTQQTYLASMIELAGRWPLAAERLESHVLWHWSRTAIRKAYQERPTLQSFERSSHEQMIAEFRGLDEEVLHHNRARVAHAHLVNMPLPGSVGITSELFRQCELKRGHKSVRWAFEKFDEMLLCIKPVCMMSPLSVATYLPPKPGLFDVVIFDEASQVRPEDALSAMARAKQIIVVGDTRQMPPTSFFDTLAQDDESEDDSFDEAVGKMESVLALCSAAVQNSHRRRDLRWHYRSLHQSLIQPSNRLFYEDRLVIFPSPIYGTTEQGSDLGLRFHYDPAATYDRGAQHKVNLLQAAQVARAVVEHMKTRPQESLLVVAFSKDQQQAVQDALEKLMEPGLAAEYNAANPHEPFRVKNLETVQGDERDVIFISVGYGRDVSGHLTMNFGPLNKEGGGRRLNVLITRAKKRTEVFTSIRSGDIVVDAQKDNGVRALKVFLEFAETGILEDRRVQGEEEDSEFEVQVRKAIESHGYQVDIQVGTAGFKIDLSIRHPKKPGLYVLGIECDGATYHRAKSARDRDKLRQLVLQSRGWRIHRIWSTDWWQNREEALRRCLVEIEQAIQQYDEEEKGSLAPPTLSTEPTEEIEIWTDELVPHSPEGSEYEAWDRPFQLQGHELHELPPPVMARCVATVVAFEGPIHLELLIKRIRDSAGLGRAGGRIRSAVLRGVDVATSEKIVNRKDDFLYWPTAGPVKARSRAQLPSSESQVDRIAPEEIDDAILTTVEIAHIVGQEGITTEVRKLLGYGAMPVLLPNIVEKRLTALVQEEKLRQENDQYRLA